MNNWEPSRIVDARFGGAEWATTIFPQFLSVSSHITARTKIEPFAYGRRFRSVEEDAIEFCAHFGPRKILNRKVLTGKEICNHLVTQRFSP